MLANLISWFYIFGLSTIYGAFLIEWRFELQSSKRHSQISWPIVVLLGLAMLTGATSLLSLVIKTGLVSNLILLGVGLGLAVFRHKTLAWFFQEKWKNLRRVNLGSVILFSAIFLVVLAKSAQVPQNYDTGLYHAQAIHWIESFPVVPGLGLLQDRLAFNSSWLLVNALFSFEFLGIQSFHALGAFLVVITAAYLVTKFDHLWDGPIHLSSVIAIVALFLIRRIFPLEFSSPGTDMPAALLVWVIFLLSVEKIEHGEARIFDSRTLAMIILSVYVLTIKLSVVPVVFLPIYFLAVSIRRIKFRSLAIQGGLALLLFAPWVGRNVILSGYLVYPVPEIDLLQAPWKIPLNQAKNTDTIIKTWARVSANEPSALSAPLSTWLPIWYQKQNPADIQLIWISVVGLVAFLGTAAVTVFRKRYELESLVGYLVIYATALGGLIYWFIEAPSIRFGYGFIGVFIGLAFAPLLAWLLGQTGKIRRLLLYGIVAGLVLYQGISIYNLVKTSDWKSQLILPADYPQAPTAIQSIGDFTFYIPTHGDQCWYNPFPCVPSITAHPVLRDSELQDGFINRP